MDLYLDARETELLIAVLEAHLEDLHREIHHTDTRAFKAELKTQEFLLQGLLARLKTPVAIGI